MARKLDKDDFVGKWALEHMRSAARASCSSASRWTNGALPAEGCQVVAPACRPGA